MFRLIRELLRGESLLDQSFEETIAILDVAKAMMSAASHSLRKSDAGGVVIGIESEDELERTLEGLSVSLAPTGYSVEEMAPVSDGVELIVGVRRDRRFGPIAISVM